NRWGSIEQRVPSAWTECHLGGWRPWFQCTARGQRAAGHPFSGLEFSSRAQFERPPPLGERNGPEFAQGNGGATRKPPRASRSLFLVVFVAELTSVSVVLYVENAPAKFVVLGEQCL